MHTEWSEVVAEIVDGSMGGVRSEYGPHDCHDSKTFGKQMDAFVGNFISCYLF